MILDKISKDIQLSREIRSSSVNNSRPLQLSSQINGEIIEMDGYLCVVGLIQPNTANVHLDSEWVTEIGLIWKFTLSLKEKIAK